MLLIDANVILRFILNDSPDMSAQARKVIFSGTAYTRPEIISEVVYVLQKVYHASKSEIRDYLYAFMKNVACTEKKYILLAADIYAEISLDFVDCLLIAYHRIGGEKVFSFDKKLNKHLDDEDVL